MNPLKEVVETTRLDQKIWMDLSAFFIARCSGSTKIASVIKERHN